MVYSYNIIKDDEVYGKGIDFGTGVYPTPKESMIDKLNYDEAFLYYVNDTFDTGSIRYIRQSTTGSGDRVLHVTFTFKEIY